MYQVEFYEKANGESDIWDFLEELRTKAQRRPATLRSRSAW